MNYTSERRAVYQIKADGSRQFLFEGLSIVSAMVAAHCLNEAAGAHRCSEHLVATDHDLIQKCSICATEFA